MLAENACAATDSLNPLLSVFSILVAISTTVEPRTFYLVHRIVCAERQRLVLFAHQYWCLRKDQTLCWSVADREA
jgi:hypothetical protein